MTYTFFIKLDDGTRIEWTGLAKSAALAMYRSTSKRQPPNVRAFGWEDRS